MKTTDLALWSLMVTIALLTAACTGGIAPAGAPATSAAMAGATATTEAPGASLPTATVPSTLTALPTVPTVAPPTEPASTDTPTPPTASSATPVEGTDQVVGTSETPIRVIIENAVLTGRLWDNATARDLIAQLPLTLTFRDFNSVEKIAQLPRKLSMDGVPAGDDPFPRDIGYYNPSGNLVFYYDDVGYFNGIVRIGQFDDSMDEIARQTGDFTARIELAN